MSSTTVAVSTPGGLLTAVCLRGGTLGWVALAVAVSLAGWGTSAIVGRAPAANPRASAIAA